MTDEAAASPGAPVRTDLPRVVGIGASAGGLEALRVLVRTLPDGMNACYAIAQHLSPTYRSMLVDLLAREATLPVVELIDGLVPKPDCIYITPAGCHVRYLDGKFCLEPTSQAGTPKPSVDTFFTSLASAFEDLAVGIVLSGTGSDGARGVRAIRASGGCTLAQDPAEAKYDGMPRSSIETDCVDVVSPIAQLGARLARLMELGASAARQDDAALMVPVLDRIVSAVKRRAGFDLGLYKPRSLERRIRRRVVATESRTLEAYAELVQTSGSEVERVVREMFISVTQFFRDASAFEALDAALGKWIEAKPLGDDLRIWVPGCATGEEAYSLAMLATEHLRRLERHTVVRLFATDLDVAALAEARKATYSRVDMGGVAPHLVDRYFIVEGEQCRIQKHLRDQVIFSEHNILHDPTFLNLDLISCRNLLIYLQAEVQQRVLGGFAQALRPGGLLFLGKAEVLHTNDELFVPVDAAAHVYRATGATPARRPLRIRTLTSPVAPTLPSKSSKLNDLGAWLAGAHTDGALAPCILVDDAGQLVHVFGDVSEHIVFSPGLATLDVMRLAVESIRLELRSVLLQAARQSGQRIAREVLIEGGLAVISLVAMRREAAGSPPMTLVIFERREVQLAAEPDGAGQLGLQVQRAALEAQLTATRDHLNTVISELESANEELQSLNEEFQSANEEMQSANEELETSNEELQSTNEELITVNEELESRTAELTMLNSDLHNLKNSLIDPLVVVDEHRRVSLFNPPAQELFALDAESIGALLFSLPCRIPVGELALTINQVIETGVLQEAILNGPRSYRLRVQPYLNPAGLCKGAVLTFHDQTALLESARNLLDAHERLQRAERFALATLDAVPAEIGVIDATGILISTNTRWQAAVDLSGSLTRGCDAGDNFLAACELRVRAGGQDEARFLAGVLSVLEGSAGHFEQESTVESGAEACHFVSTVTSFGEGEKAPYFIITHRDVTARKRQDTLMRLQARALDTPLSGICIADARKPNLPLVYVNQHFVEMTGYSADEVLGLNCRLLQGTDTRQPALLQVRRAIASHEPVRVLLRNYRKDGRMFWNELSLAPIVEDGVLTHIVGTQRDNTELLASEAALKASLERESQALAFAGLGSLELDIRGSHIVLSKQHARLLDLSDHRGELGLPDFRRLIVAEDLPLFDDSVKLCVAGHASLDLEYRITRRDGSIRWLHTSGNVVLDSNDIPVRLLALSMDVSARRDAEERVRFIAHHDALTGLPNRSLLSDRFQQALNGARRAHTRLGLLFIDLDHFKDINDTLGHDVGDALLISVADSMRAAVRDTDTTCRQSGDEFVVLLPGVRDVNDVAHLADKLVEAVRQPRLVLGRTLTVTCSVGVSLYPDDGDTFDSLMRHADSAMYQAKGVGRNGVEFFARNLSDRHHERLAISSALRVALERKEFVLHYQPQFDARSGRLVGIEALLRWQHPDRGLVFPDDFIELAEQSDLIVPLGAWVLHEACAQAKRWQDAGLTKVPMAVNISAHQLRQRNIIETVSAALHDSGLGSEWLELEITERGILANTDKVGDILADFRHAGIRLALDDFGTGSSSLSNLHRYPVDKLKIDRSFVAASPDDASAAAIVCAVISLANSMSLDLVAEGVETPAQLSLLREAGCRSIQGYLAGKGTTAEELETSLRLAGGVVPAWV